MDFENLQPVKLFCPNCGKLIVGYKKERNAVMILCSKCGVIVFSRQVNKREIAIRVTSPN